MLKCNQQCDQKHWYTCISYYYHMTLKKYAATLYLDFSLHLIL